jgi:hypothetical protein
MELPACRFGKPFGFTEKQVMGPLLSHKTIPSHKHKSFKQTLYAYPMSTYAQQLSTRRPTDHNDKHGSTLENTDEYKHGSPCLVLSYTRPVLGERSANGGRGGEAGVGPHCPPPPPSIQN